MENRFENIDIDLPKEIQIGILDDANLALLVNFKRETNRVDYKETFYKNDKKLQQDFSKDISALANIGGGYLVIGVDNKKLPVGISPEIEKDLDPTIISKIFSKYISPTINLHTYVGNFLYKKKKLRIGIIYVPEFEKRPHIIKETFTYYDQQKNVDVTNLYKGTIYVRKHTSSQPLDSDSWEELLERFYLKLTKIRRGEISREEREDVFNLERNVFFNKIYSELGKK